MAHWQCISGCGACCRLDPALRGEDLDRLSEEQRRTYLAMVGEDGWCIHFDTGSRRCRIYDARPDFCRVENLLTLFAEPDAATLPPQSDAGPPVEIPCSPETSGSVCGDPGGGVSLHRDSDGDAVTLDPEAQALAIASCRTQIRAEYGGRGRVMKRFEQAIRRTP